MATPITDKALRELGFQGDDMDMWIVLPNGDTTELHIEKDLSAQDRNILFTKGNTQGIPGRDFVFVYVGAAISIQQIKALMGVLSIKT